MITFVIKSHKIIRIGWESKKIPLKPSQTLISESFKVSLLLIKQDATNFPFFYNTTDKEMA